MHSLLIVKPNSHSPSMKPWRGRAIPRRGVLPMHARQTTPVGTHMTARMNP